MKHVLIPFLFLPSIVIGCVVPPAQQPTGGGTGSPAYNAGGSGGVNCDAYCSKQAECGAVPEYQPCVDYCQANASDPNFAQSVIDLTDNSCEELAAKRNARQQQQQGGGGGGGGDGSGCRASAARGGNPVQDCPAMQECCGGGCHSIGYCGMPTGR